MHPTVRLGRRPSPRTGSGGPGDDVADLLVGAVRRIEVVTAADQPLELCFKDGQLTLPRLHVVQLRRKQHLHVGARDGTLPAQIEDAGDFAQGESGCLSAADEREPGEDRGVVLPVAVRTGRGCGNRRLRS